MTNTNEVLRKIEQAIDEDRKGWVIQTLPTGEKKTYVIWNWMDIEVFWGEYKREKQATVNVQTINTYREIEAIINGMEGTVVFADLILV